jgi:hypothetical protein
MLDLMGVQIIEDHMPLLPRVVGKHRINKVQELHPTPTPVVTRPNQAGDGGSGFSEDCGLGYGVHHGGLASGDRLKHGHWVAAPSAWTSASLGSRGSVCERDLSSAAPAASDGRQHESSGNCWDNGVVERVFRSVKHEGLDDMAKGAVPGNGQSHGHRHIRKYSIRVTGYTPRWTT